MKLLELMCDKIINSDLFEQAFRRQEVESQITNLAHPVIEHLIKVLKWDDPINYNKHIGDINEWMYKIQRYKLKGNKKPYQCDYFQWMYTDWVTDADTISLWIRGLHRYSKLLVLRTDEEVYNIIRSILYQISYDLPINKYTTILNYLK